MNEPAIPLASAVQDLVRAAASRALSHPAQEDLAAYAEGELEPQAEEDIRSHLAVCQECATTVLDLARFPMVERRAALQTARDRLCPTGRRSANAWPRRASLVRLRRKSTPGLGTSERRIVTSSGPWPPR